MATPDRGGRSLRRLGWMVLGVAMWIAMTAAVDALSFGVQKEWHPPEGLPANASQCSVFLHRPPPFPFGSEQAEMWVGPTADRGTVVVVSDNGVDELQVKWDELAVTITERSGIEHRFAATACPDGR